MKAVNVGIIGGTGYTGLELLRILARHPLAEARIITSRGEAGKPVTDLFPSLTGHCDLLFSDPEGADLKSCDFVFSAAPNGVAMTHARGLLDAGVKFIDLSADFRIRDVAVWEQWYGLTHACPELLEQAVYGLPEVNRQSLGEARLVANPGCYPTAVQLGYIPLVENGLVELDSLISDAKSGISGAGRNANMGTLFSEVSDSFKAYAASGHRHLPEIIQGLQDIAGEAVEMVFTPHLLPLIRGIHATLYARLNEKGLSLSMEDMQQLFLDRYQNEPFVQVLPSGAHPDTRSVRGSNYCRISIHRPQGGKTITVLSVEDNLVKGAAGQAIQNMNLMAGFPEESGLGCIALVP